MFFHTFPATQFYLGHVFPYPFTLLFLYALEYREARKADQPIENWHKYHTVWGCITVCIKYLLKCLLSMLPLNYLNVFLRLFSCIMIGSLRNTAIVGKLSHFCVLIYIPKSNNLYPFSNTFSFRCNNTISQTMWKLSPTLALLFLSPACDTGCEGLLLLLRGNQANCTVWFQFTDLERRHISPV